MTLEYLSEPIKHTMDALAIGTLLATLLSWMPAIAAILSVVWLSLRIYESWQNIRLNNQKLRK